MPELFAVALEASFVPVESHHLRSASSWSSETPKVAPGPCERSAAADVAPTVVDGCCSKQVICIWAVDARQDRPAYSLTLAPIEKTEKQCKKLAHSATISNDKECDANPMCLSLLHTRVHRSTIVEMPILNRFT